ncbi:MAG: hypothetical protein CL612_01770 [Anaerolineaceae bacterium]|jgi:2-iminobutanoate/2-iminopropanoate deaminase|nr:hypothetical protein [Anaerolineaceae bacterium]MDP6586206.1 RidA family protein [Anaerolineales bacterium]MDP6771271.1 RidA family protein [Anaerolineales bacterium]|tara:strand:- start:12659 stop:13006 length:348 start_codon:yes stop_codon:yes gene_type:complete
MAKEVVPGNPGAPFAKAVKISGMMFTSGNCAAGDGIQAQTRQVLSNLEEILKAEGASLKDVVKATVYLTNMADFSAMNETYVEIFGDDRPARTTVGVKELARDDFLIEIDLVVAL